MIKDIREIENYVKMIKYFEDIGTEYYDFYEYNESHDYSKSVHILVGIRISPIKLHIEIDQKNDVVVFSLWVSVRATKFMFEGDTSDCTDIISSVVTIIISVIENIELALSDMFNPTFVDGEIYGRTIAFIDPKIVNANFESNEFMEQLERIMALTSLANMIMCKIINFKPYCNDIVRLTESEFSLGIKKVFGEDGDSSGCNYIKRKNEDWEWVYNEDVGISVINFKNNIGEKLLDLILDEEIVYLSGVKRDLISYKNKIHAIDREKFSYIKSILKLYKEEKYNVVAIKNKFFVISPNNIISIPDECGGNSVNEEKRLIRERRRLEDKILFGEASFQWNTKIDGGRFEDLIREILSKEMYISRIRKAGPTNQPDNGLDLIIEYIDFSSNNFDDGEKPFEIKKIIGQCKAYKGTVGKSNVTDIRDTLDYYDAQGYWLFVSSQISVHLSEHLQKLRDKNEYLIDWWNRVEIEEMLRDYPEIVDKYKDIFIVN